MVCGPGSIVGIATGYGVDGPGIESRWRRDFPRLFRSALGPTQPPVQWVPGHSPGVSSSRGVTLAPYPLLVSWSRKSRAIPIVLLWAVRPVQNLSACTRVHFTFFTVWGLVSTRVKNCVEERHVIEKSWWHHCDSVPVASCNFPESQKSRNGRYPDTNLGQYKLWRYMNGLNLRLHSFLTSILVVFPSLSFDAVGRRPWKPANRRFVGLRTGLQDWRREKSFAHVGNQNAIPLFCRRYLCPFRKS